MVCIVFKWATIGFITNNNPLDAGIRSSITTKHAAIIINNFPTTSAWTRRLIDVKLRLGHETSMYRIDNTIIVISKTIGKEKYSSLSPCFIIYPKKQKS